MGRLLLRLPPVPTSVPQSRHRVSAWLDDSGIVLDPASRDDVLVVVTELVTNGVLHDGGDAIAVCAEADQRGVSLDIETADSTSGAATRYRTLSDAGEYGRGLAIVQALADDITTEIGNGRRRVSCHIGRQQGC
jgi:anti-sigma regulatory factor (Ser/Thr protein kinase)